MEQIGQAFYTGAGMLWKALWALISGYIMSRGRASSAARPTSSARPQLTALCFTRAAGRVTFRCNRALPRSTRSWRECSRSKRTLDACGQCTCDASLSQTQTVVSGPLNN